MTRNIDYASAEIPEDEAPENYSWQARRAEILRRIKEAGHPAALNQAELGREFGTSRQNINNDMDALADYVEDNLGRRRALTAKCVFDRCLEGLLEQEEYAAAARVVRNREEWLTEREDLRELEERIENISEKQNRAKYR
ncbi:hypothetical protein [Halopelagius fulvigenes]|uniref:HTH domain-containing protein n=1 Tax=Halopelagius fulvigenes TaxID=1198324 RepID=A0ABD5TWH7_9EURY